MKSVFQRAASALDPGASESMQALEELCVHYNPLGLLNVSTGGFHSQMFWRLISQVQDEPSLLKGEILGL